MLTIRLSRGGRHKAPFFRIVLTEHSRPVKSGYKDVLGWYDPLQHKTEVDADAVKLWIGKGAQPSNRVAKLLLNHTGDDFFKAYVITSDRKKRGKNTPEEVEVAPQAPTEKVIVEETAPTPEVETPEVAEA